MREIRITTLAVLTLAKNLKKKVQRNERTRCLGRGCIFGLDSRSSQINPISRNGSRIQARPGGGAAKADRTPRCRAAVRGARIRTPWANRGPQCLPAMAGRWPSGDARFGRGVQRRGSVSETVFTVAQCGPHPAANQEPSRPLLPSGSLRMQLMPFGG